MRSRRLPQIGLLLLLTGMLSGCLLFRIYEFKEQFCDYQRNFQLLVGDDITLLMLNPVLFDDDLVWLLGAEPSYREQRDGELDLVYVVEKDLPVSDPELAIPLRLRFTNNSGDYRLSAGIIHKNLGTMITPGLIDETVAHTCDSETNIADKNVSVDLSDLDPDAIPRRQEIEQALGEPTEVYEDGRVVVYRFRLRDAQPGVEKSRARVWYGEDGELVERVRFRYLRYELDANFAAGIGVISIDL